MNGVFELKEYNEEKKIVENAIKKEKFMNKVMNNELLKTKIDKRMGIEYHLEGDYYIPNLACLNKKKLF